jgi:hypothetical protein
MSYYTFECVNLGILKQCNATSLCYKFIGQFDALPFFFSEVSSSIIVKNLPIQVILSRSVRKRMRLDVNFFPKSPVVS